jgi:formyltetrahydrofolate hydrolase
MMQQTAKLLVSCPDRKGLVGRISDFVFRNGGNFPSYFLLRTKRRGKPSLHRR